MVHQVVMDVKVFLGDLLEKIIHTHAGECLVKIISKIKTKIVKIFHLHCYLKDDFG